MMSAAPMARAGAEEIAVTGARAKLAEQSNLGDYKLYTLPEPVTLNARQTKQVAFLDQKDVAFQRLYAVEMDSYDDYDNADWPLIIPDVVLRLENKTANGLGKPLPSGALSAIETAGGADLRRRAGRPRRGRRRTAGSGDRPRHGRPRPAAPGRGTDAVERARPPHL